MGFIHDQYPHHLGDEFFRFTFSVSAWGFESQLFRIFQLQHFGSKFWSGNFESPCQRPFQKQPLTLHQLVSVKMVGFSERNTLI